jgi:hypothetical protein
MIIIKKRRTRCEEHVACMVRSLICMGFWCESQNERDNYEDLDIGRRIILRLISGRMERY